MENKMVVMLKVALTLHNFNCVLSNTDFNMENSFGRTLQKFT